MRYTDAILNSILIDTLIGWFAGFIIHQELNFSYRVKRLFKLRVTKYVKLLDCYPCFTFWVALAITLNPISAIGAYLIAQILDKK